MFMLEAIHDYYQLSWDNLVLVQGDFYQNEVAEVLLGCENAWPLQTPK